MNLLPITPCIWFDGKGREAADFYMSVFANSSLTNDAGVMVSFNLAGQPFLALNGGPMYSPNPSISLFVMCETAEEVDALYAKLSEGGTTMMPPGTYPWCERYTFFQDKYKVSWQLYLGDYATVGQKITPCFLFVNERFGQAEKAIHWYTSLFPDSSIQGISKYGDGEVAPAGTVKHAQFVLNKKVVMAMDGPGQHQFDFNEGFSFVIHCDTQQEIDHFWEAITANGGQESMCGWCKDPFGVSWQVVPSGIGALLTDPQKGAKAMSLLMGMKKIDWVTLQKA